ncbi:uncharacterized protein LOC105211395 [Zeugodacus cucurbitae]|uniref:uncharacterized protein LOC105211395 n=1 Tax=Zeugodacus cucurbitae TaxID=28588 RepID=UPI0023D96E35|nr:uncharacterized protein LOC105211395 [Zeugodacus cucurbitae]
MSSYSFRGTAKTWIPREGDQIQPNITAVAKQQLQISATAEGAYPDPDNDKWNVKQLMRLLRLYGAHHCLWDTRHPDNRNRKLRKAALIDITAAMGEGCTCAQVLQKINVLRATYRYEKRRIKQRMRKGIGAKTKLKWFALADSFLRNVPRAEINKKKEEADSDSDLENAIVFTIEPEALISLSDDEHFQNDDCNIKVKLEKVNTHFPTSSCTEVASPSCSKTEEMSTSVDELTEKRKWTTHESLQFIFLLRSYPLLWQLDLNDSSLVEQQLARREKALEDISHTMQLPSQRLRRRLETFLAIYRQEMAAIKQDSQHKPNFAWWPMVQEYLETPQLAKSSTNEDIEEDNQLNREEIEPSPLNMNNYHSNDALYFSAPASPTVSQICSPLTPAHNEDSNSNNDTYAAAQQNYTNPPLKLVWNGLEDDLLEGKWSLKHSVKFLRLYGAHRCLWDLSDPDYRSREMRAAAIEDIAAAMGYGLDPDYVAKKIKIFRITYMQHRKRMLEAIKQNRAPDIQLRWFPLADSFLRPHIGLRSIKEQEREMPQFDFQYVYANLNLIDPSLLADLK